VVARAKKTRKRNNFAIFIDKVLTRGVDVEKLLADPVALASMSGVKLTRPQKAQLSKLPLKQTLDQLYTELGGLDKRFLMAKKPGPGRPASVAPTMVIPLVGVVIAVAVVATVATVVTSVPGTKVVDNSPRAKDKL
jgi:hypothetical protein